VLRAELEEEAASGFPRLRRIPQTDIIWFLDYFAGLPAAERGTLLDALADAAAMAFGPPGRPVLNARGTVDCPPGLARLIEARERPGAKGGTRYTDMKMMCADPSLRDPAAYHPSWRVHLTEVHFQPRPDLLPSLDHLKAARAPLVRKLVNAAFPKSLGWQNEKKPGGAVKYIGRCGKYEASVMVDFGGMLSQLGYTVTLRNPADRSPVFIQLSYEALWGTGGRWDYLTEENAPRCIAFFAEQIAYLADLGERVSSRTIG
jgi:hypothetical protein